MAGLITDLTALAETPATGDLLELVDVSDTTLAATGTNKKITRANLVGGLAASGANTDITSVYLNNIGLKIKDTNASHGLSIVPGSDLTADKTLTVTTGDSDRTISLSANLTIPADPNADKLLGWDDSAGATAYIGLGNGLSTDATPNLIVDSASDTVDGIVELAIASEVNTGTDATRAVTPDALAGSNYGIEYMQVALFAPATDAATGDGKAYLHIPPKLNGWNLVYVHALNAVAGTTGTQDIQIANVTDAVDMLSTKLTIDSTEVGSNTAATAAVIDTTKDDVATNDILRIDVDAVQTTKGKGTVVTLGFQLP